MKNLKYKVIFTYIICFCIMILIPANVVGASNASAYDKDRFIFDEAGLLSESDFKELEQLCMDYTEEAGIKIVILTHNDPSAKDAEIYVEDFYDIMLYGDSVILLVDMYNRDVLLEGYGLAETYIHSKRGDVIIDDIIPYLSSEQYRDAFEIFIKSSAAYMKDDSELNYDHNYIYNDPPTGGSNNSGSNYDTGYDTGYRYNYDNNSRTIYSRHYNQTDNLFLNIWFQLFVSLIIGGIVVGTLAYNSGGKMTAGSNNYIDMKNSRLIGRKDQYIRTSVTRVRKPTQNNNTGGGGFNAGGFRGGVSSGGHSHSTSRGKF